MGWLLGWSGLASGLMSDLARFALSTPDITQVPALVALWQTSLGLSAALAALLTAAAGGFVALPASLGARMDLRAVAVRAVFAVLLASQSLRLVGWLIHLTNLADRAFGQSAALESALRAPTPPGGILTFVVAIVPYLALLVVLAVIYAVRLVELFVLAAVAPLALICGLSPASDGLARAWAAELLAVLLLQPVQVLLLVLFEVSVVDLSAQGSPPEALVSSLAILYLTLRLPGWLRRMVHSVGQESVTAALAWAASRARWPTVR